MSHLFQDMGTIDHVKENSLDTLHILDDTINNITLSLANDEFIFFHSNVQKVYESRMENAAAGIKKRSRCGKDFLKFSLPLQAAKSERMKE